MPGYLNLINVNILVCLLEFLDSNFHCINLEQQTQSFMTPVKCRGNHK